MYINRNMEKTLNRLMGEYPVLMVCGSRQVGKSTLLNHMKEPARHYVTLDNLAARTLAIEDPTLFIQTYNAPIIIDEFQYAPDLLSVIKEVVDREILNEKDASNRFWLTGSQQFKMMKNISESLAGRVGILDLSSLSKAEIEGRYVDAFHPSIEKLKIRSLSMINKDIHEIYGMIFRGGMPKLISSNIDREQYYSDYIRTYIERDIKDLAQVGNITAFYNFLVYLAARTAQEINYASISKAIGVSAPTVKQWVSILESSGIVYLLHPFYSDLSKRLVKSPKLYFMDTGLCAYLCKWPTAETLEVGAMDGAFLETYVISEIIKSYYNAGKRLDFYYYRDIDQKEIDLVFIEGNDIYPIEIKKGVYPSQADKNFHVLKKYKYDMKPGIILCMCDQLVPMNKDVWYCPISLL